MCKKVIVLSTLLVSMGWLSSTALAQPPVKTNLVFWLDSSNTATLTVSANKVSRWNDPSGNGNYADQTTASLQPTYIPSKVNGKGIVDFGDSVYFSGTQTQPWMQMRDATGAVLHISTIRTVFWVLGMDSGTNGFLLGDDVNYHFHRGTANQIWEAPNGWASTNIRNGSTYLNGVKVDGTTTVLPTAFSMVSLVTTANVQASLIARDRTYRSGGIKLGEVLIYDRPLTDAERVSVEAYLHTKWFVPGSAVRSAAGGCRDGRAARRRPELDRGPVCQDARCVPRERPLPTSTAPAGRAPRACWSARDSQARRILPAGLPSGRPIIGGWMKSTLRRTTRSSRAASGPSRPSPTAIRSRNVTATASSAQPNMGPEKTIDGSGLTGDLHGIDGTTMWMSQGVQPNWIQYQFDKAYKLYDLKVWNSNQMIEPYHRLRRQGRQDRILHRRHHLDSVGQCAPVRPGRPAWPGMPPTPPSASAASWPSTSS